MDADTEHEGAATGEPRYMVRTTSVLDIAGLPHLGRVVFHRRPEEPDDPRMATQRGPIGLPLLSLPRDTWEAMGEPRKVTIIIEPGDMLNDPQSDSILWVDPDERDLYDATQEDGA